MYALKVASAVLLMDADRHKKLKAIANGIIDGMRKKLGKNPSYSI